MTTITGTAGVEASLYQPAVTPDMSRTAAEKSWEGIVQYKRRPFCYCFRVEERVQTVRE